VVVEERAERKVRGRAVAGVVLAAAMVLLSIGGGQGGLSVVKAVVLGAVEGITEFLPVSSTGHLLVTQRLLDLGTGDGKTAADTYVVAIQIGAIAAVLALYWPRIASMIAGVVGRDPEGRRLTLSVAAAFAPAAVIGFLLGDTIKDALFAPWPVIAAWAAGGVFLLVWKPAPGRSGIEQLTVRPAFVIGLVQVLALWPGVSRSLVTIVAALAVGMTLAAAIEFSFLLGLVTLSAATVLDLAKDGSTMVDLYGWRTPLLGALVAFATAYLAVRWMVAYLRERPLAHFGVYRLLAAGGAAVLVLTGAIS
jgi:undecaprenyl-diphosphatase